MRIQPRSKRTLEASMATAFIAVALPLVLSACDPADFQTVGAELHPSDTRAITASINQPVAQTASAGIAACAFNPFFTPTFDVIVVSIMPVHVEGVTIRLLDGSVLGGPMVPFPSSLPQFGVMFMPAGITRTFRFHPSFACGTGVPRAVRACITFVNHVGVRQAFTVDAPFR